jgi:hypothetical protein
MPCDTTKVEMVVDLTATQALGLSVLPSLIAGANE